MRRAGIAIIVLLTACILSSGASAQSVVTIRLINGRNGKPLAKIRVQISFDDLKGRTTIDLTSNEQGEIQFAANESKTFQVHPIGIVSCGEQVIGAPYYHDYSIAEILKAGALTQNTCGHGNYEPQRGKLLYFARRATWWELIRN